MGKRKVVSFDVDTWTDMKLEAVNQGQTLSAYLVGLHRMAGRTLVVDDSRQMETWDGRDRVVPQVTAEDNRHMDMHEGRSQC